MILWINGAFGAGKTQTAWELHRRIPGSFVYDPENVGYFIRKNSPKELNGGDFQDIPLWRSMNYELMLRLDREYGGIIIAPMTIVRQDYYDEIIGRLRQSGVEVRHCVLYASRETLRKRLRGRLERADAWSVRQIDRCVNAFDSGYFENVILTDSLTISQQVDEAAKVLGIELVPDNRNPLAKWIGRIGNQIRSIRN